MLNVDNAKSKGKQRAAAAEAEPEPAEGNPMHHLSSLIWLHAHTRASTKRAKRPSKKEKKKKNKTIKIMSHNHD